MPRSMTGAAVRTLICVLFAWAAFVGVKPGRWAGVPARGDVIFELAPSLGAGATDNARVVAGDNLHTSDSFTIVGGSARLRYAANRSTHAIGYRGTYTHYLEDNGTTTLSNALALTSDFELSARWALAFSLTGALTRTSGVDPNDPAVFFQQAAVPGSTKYLSTAAMQRLGYQPTPASTYGETLSFTQLKYLEAMVNGVATPLPTTTVVTLALDWTREVGREAFSLETAVGDSIVDDVDPAQMRGPYTQGHVFIGRMLAGWKHDLSAVWSTMLQAGPSIIFKLDGEGVIAPAAIASLNYARVPWFAGVTASQAPSANLFLGAATLSDQVLARLTIPLTRNETLYVGGYGGYIYARIADARQHLTRAYDQVMGTVTVVYRFPGTRIAAALSYTALSQRGSEVPDYAVPDLARQSVLLTVRSDFAWGPGAPPLFGGPL